ncbi:MAG TPA: STAS domain-containing protein [Actinomycetes bacterium]|nr:STAS domain-containing protein [Actinomycetes bacterium]
MHPFDVSLPSRVDATTSGDVRYALNVALDSIHQGDLTVDASAVDSLDVAGLGVLVAAHRRARQRGVRLVICDPQPRVLRILAVTRLHRVLNLDRVNAAVG